MTSQQNPINASAQRTDGGEIEYEFSIELPITARLQGEEYEDCKAEARERGVPVARVIFDRAIEKTLEVLKVGATQFDGALLVVESRDSDAAKAMRQAMRTWRIG